MGVVFSRRLFKVYFRLRIPEGINTEDKSAMSEKNRQELLKDFMVYLSADAKRWAPYPTFNTIDKPAIKALKIMVALNSM